MRLYLILHFAWVRYDDMGRGEWKREQSDIVGGEKARDRVEVIGDGTRGGGDRRVMRQRGLLERYDGGNEGRKRKNHIDRRINTCRSEVFKQGEGLELEGGWNVGGNGGRNG